MKSALLSASVYFVKFAFELLVVINRNIEIAVKFLEDLKFQLVQVKHIDPSSELEGLVIIVEVILELGGKQNCSQHHFVCIEVVQAEVLHRHVVSVDVNNGNH